MPTAAAPRTSATLAVPPTSATLAVPPTSATLAVPPTSATLAVPPELPATAGWSAARPIPTTAGCMKLGGKAVGGVCPTTCDFFCSENWRIEKDSDGCYAWRYERRAPRAGENSFCTPVLDGSSGGDGPDSAPASCNSWQGAIAVGGHWYAGNCQACACTAEGAVCTERCELQSDGGLHDVCESTYHSRLVPGSPAKCPVCGPDSSQFPVQCDEQGLTCHYEGSNFGALCTCGGSPRPIVTDAASASLAFVCLL